MPDLEPCRNSLEPAATQLKILLEQPAFNSAGAGFAAQLDGQPAYSALKMLNTEFEFAGFYPMIVTLSPWSGGSLPSGGIEAAATAVLNAMLLLKNNPLNFDPIYPQPPGPGWWFQLTSCNPGPQSDLLAVIHEAMDQSGGPIPRPDDVGDLFEQISKLRETLKRINTLSKLPGIGKRVGPHETMAPAAKRAEYRKLRLKAAQQSADVEVMKIKLGF